jgi:putative acetyltransferase
MKIRPLTADTQAKAASLLHHAFAPSTTEVRLFDALHAHGRTMLEWVCLHRDAVIAYIGFTQAYDRHRVVGLHLALLAVQPRMQHQGIGSELLRFALRQEAIRQQALFVLGNPKLYQKFGFAPCALPICPFDRNNAHFLALRNDAEPPYTVGYDPEFRKSAPR